MKQDDGGPAFPTVKWRTTMGGPECQTQTGMTLRDYFAAAALTGMLANPTTCKAAGGPVAYTYAADMLAERAKRMADQDVADVKVDELIADYDKHRAVVEAAKAWLVRYDERMADCVGFTGGCVDLATAVRALLAAEAGTAQADDQVETTRD